MSWFGPNPFKEKTIIAGELERFEFEKLGKIYKLELVKYNEHWAVRGVWGSERAQYLYADLRTLGGYCWRKEGSAYFSDCLLPEADARQMFQNIIKLQTPKIEVIQEWP